MKKQSSTIILILVFIAGLSLLLYPSVSNWWNERVQTKAIASYVEAVENYSDADFSAALKAARSYNETLVGNSFRYYMDEETEQTYLSLLNTTGSGIMAYIEVPAIHITLPIYHGTSEAVLQTGIGHMEGSSLPVGGENTHCVLSGHRGLPSAKLFTNLNKLVEGDVFYIRTLDELYTYEVDQILIVEPSDISALEIEHCCDYCTLVTCTPYGINSHRLLVRGTRIENPEEVKQLYIMADAVQIDSILLAPLIALPVLLVLFVILLFNGRKSRRKGVKKDEN